MTIFFLGFYAQANREKRRDEFRERKALRPFVTSIPLTRYLSSDEDRLT
jgi:hypothetical protein